MSATHAGRVIQSGVVETAGFKRDNTVISMLLHVFLGAENNGAGRTGFDACRFLPDCHPAGTQGALLGHVVFFGNAWNVESSTCTAIAATYAVYFVEVDNAVVVLGAGPWRRAGFQAARPFALYEPSLQGQQD